MRALLALASAVVGAAAASHWEALSGCVHFEDLLLLILILLLIGTPPFPCPSFISIFDVSRSTASRPSQGALDAIVEKLAQRITSAQPHPPPSVVVLPSAASISASQLWSSIIPLGLIAVSSLAVSRYFGSGAESISAVAQVRKMLFALTAALFRSTLWSLILRPV